MARKLPLAGAPHCCDQACGSVELLDHDDTYSFCRAWGQFLPWVFVDGSIRSGESAPERCLGCLEEKD
jgi:hypothetical protein